MRLHSHCHGVSSTYNFLWIRKQWTLLIKNCKWSWFRSVWMSWSKYLNVKELKTINIEFAVEAVSFSFFFSITFKGMFFAIFMILLTSVLENVLLPNPLGLNEPMTNSNQSIEKSTWEISIVLRRKRKYRETFQFMIDCNRWANIQKRPSKKSWWWQMEIWNEKIQQKQVNTMYFVHTQSRSDSAIIRLNDD